ncbi:MAG: hypothetical protein V7776_23205, partial [Halopseudomonas aestusnigri]
FVERHEETREIYQESFDALLKDGEFDAVIAAGSQTLTSSELALAAISRTGGELGRTARHYVDNYVTDGGWNTQNTFITAVSGPDAIHLPSSSGDKLYFTFLNPLLASGEEVFTREEVGKNEFTTSLTIDDLDGWTIIDHGSNETTFDVSKIVNFGHDVNGFSHKVRSSILAGGSNDTYLGRNAEITFDGGNGTDTASYANFEENEGIHFTFATQGTVDARIESILARKILAEGHEEYQETINTHTEQYGKRTEAIEYRDIEVVQATEERSVNDTLRNVEIIQGTSKADVFSLYGSDVVEQISGFGGNDILELGFNTNVALGGSGDDIFDIRSPLSTLKSKVESGIATQDDYIYLNGGTGIDVIRGTSGLWEAIFDRAVDLQNASALANIIADALEPDSDSTELSTVVETYLAKDPNNIFDRVILDEIEHVRLNPYYFRTFFDLTIDTYEGVNVYDNEGLRINEDIALYTPTDTHSQGAGSYFGRSSGNLTVATTRIYVESGQTYEFKDVSGNTGNIKIDGRTVYEHLNSSQKITDIYVAQHTGYVDLEFFTTQDRGYTGGLPIYARVNGEGAFDTFETIADIQLINAGTPALENTWFASKFNSVLGEALNGASGALLEARNGLIDVYNNVSTEVSADGLKYWARNHRPSEYRVDTSAIDDEIAEDTLHHYQGEVFLNADETVTFRDDSDNKALLFIGEKRVLFSNSSQDIVNGEFTAEFTGWHEYDFYAYNEKQGGNADLKVSIGDSQEYFYLHGETQVTVELFAGYETVTTGVTLIGDEFRNSLIGSNTSDSIFGQQGHDVIEGGSGNDVLSGGAGRDTFNFGYYSGNDVIVEVFEEDWIDNTIRFETYSFDEIEVFRDENDSLVYWINENQSLTLYEYFTAGDAFENGVPRLRTQRLIDETGEVRFMDENSRPGSFNTGNTFEMTVERLTSYQDWSLDISETQRIQDAFEAQESVNSLRFSGSVEDILYDAATDILFSDTLFS